MICLVWLVSALGLSAQKAHFAILSDTHVSPGTPAEVRLTDAIAEINNSDFDFVIVNGDLTNQGADDELRNIHQLLQGVKAPLYVVPGNHENNWSQSATKTFVDLWGADRFAFVHDSLVFVDINCGPYMKMGDGHVKREDLLWLKATLDSLVQPGYKVVSLNHYPIRKDDLDSWEAYAALLSAYPTLIHINGHYHSWQTYKVSTTGIPGAMVRALDMKGDVPGYTIVDIDPEWIHFYNKRTGEQAEPMFAFPARVKTTAQETAQESVAGQSLQLEHLREAYADKASIFTRLAFDENNVYFGNSLGEAKAVDKNSGELRWTVDLGAPVFSRPVVLEKGNIAFPNATGIKILDPATGLVVKDYPSAEGPYVADGKISGKSWLQGGYKRMENRDAKTGRLKWTYSDLDNYCQASPVIDGDDVIFGAWDCYLRCLDLKSGRLKWKWSNEKSNQLFSPGNVVPVVNDDYVIIVAPDRYMTCLSRADGKEIWRDNSHRYRESLGCNEDATVAYAKTMDGELVAVDATSPTFRELWTVDMGLGYEHAPCIVAEKDGVAYAGSRRGIVTAVDTEARQVLWQETVGAGEINGIDLDPTTGALWVSLIDGTIFEINFTTETRR